MNFWPWGRNAEVLTRLRAIQLTLNRMEKTMTEQLENLANEVQETRGVMQSAKTLIEGLKVALDEAIASGDPAALQALSDSLDEGTNDLAAAVEANQLP